MSQFLCERQFLYWILFNCLNQHHMWILKYLLLLFQDHLLWTGTLGNGNFDPLFLLPVRFWYNILYIETLQAKNFLLETIIIWYTRQWVAKEVCWVVLSKMNYWTYFAYSIYVEVNEVLIYLRLTMILICIVCQFVHLDCYFYSKDYSTAQ